MNSKLAPTYQKLFGGFWVLWYAVSNSYSVITPEFKHLLDAYLDAKTASDFASTLPVELSDSEQQHISDTLIRYLKTSNKPFQPLSYHSTALDSSKRVISRYYTFGDQSIQVYYSSEKVQKIVHPAMAHYESPSALESHTVFDIHLSDGELYLFKDEELIIRVPQKDYHHIQGKFIMLLLCTLHDKEEQDWIGTIHGSTITDNHNALLFIGKSGKGKSTLSALLAAHEFQLLADDVSPLLSENQHIYYNPAAISIKEGAFQLLESVVPDFENLPVVHFNPSKGNLKYLPCSQPENNHYPCRAIILVNYTAGAPTSLEPVDIKQVLETIIEDSWLSPTPKHAQQFLDWLATVDLFKLTYSDTTSVRSEISKLFERYKKPI